MHIIRLESWHIVGVRNGVDGKFRFFGSPNLLFSVEGQEALFRKRGCHSFREAVNDVTLRTKIDAFHKMMVETFGDRIPRFATLLDGGGQANPVCSQGSTGNQFSPRVVGVLVETVCWALAFAR